MKFVKRTTMLMLSLVCLMYVSSISISSYSYLQDIESTANGYTVGTADCTIVDSLTKPSAYTKGTVINNTVSVKNSGSVPCYIRIYVSPSYSVDSFTFNMQSDSSLTGSAKWYKSGDWYYYKSIVNAGETTSALYTRITLNTDMSSWSSDNMQIIKYAECIQSDGFSSCVNAFN